MKLKNKAKVNCSGKFYAVAKESHLLYEAFEITVENGEVVKVTNLRKAPDMLQVLVKECEQQLWTNARQLSSKSVLGG